ncbi:LysR family transcriptional regulator [Pseudonocardia asaccharolytica]|uniref:Transcriptional regulator n=1 Tax=Pseudonocardia asaccharolytica DSM 44247 = NBRC 16224 TaxID=1123024 RepID=A0A511D5K6_9PSEU|nr:LysR family transcriptional regulator [Pseudonocardia asaccharolytica]GEL20082.1 transcriptional regulator [Pseudonocardia asaccharolytica DSM 44247 = NBRC 16224]
MALHPAAPQLADLDLLLSVNRLGSLGKAAKEHGVSQPAASVRIRAMERRLGLRLLERSPSGSQFTPAGIALAKWAQSAVDAVSQLMECSAILTDRGSGSLRISACLTTAEYLVPRWVTGLRAQLSDVSVCVQANDARTVLENARSGKIDLGFVGIRGRHPDLHQRVVGHDELVVVVSPDHPWAHRQVPLSPAELAVGRLVLREQGSGTRQVLRQGLGELWRDSAYIEFPSTTAIKEAVAEGAGAGVLSRLATAREIDEGRLVRVPVAGIKLTRRLWAVWDKRSELGAPARALLELAAREQRAAARPGPGGHSDPVPSGGKVVPMPMPMPMPIPPRPIAMAAGSEF